MHYLSALFGKEMYVVRKCEYGTKTPDDGQ
jgi:hypothetical protein